MRVTLLYFLLMLVAIPMSWADAPVYQFNIGAPPEGAEEPLPLTYSWSATSEQILYQFSIAVSKEVEGEITESVLIDGSFSLFPNAFTRGDTRVPWVSASFGEIAVESSMTGPLPYQIDALRDTDFACKFDTRFGVVGEVLRWQEGDTDDLLHDLRRRNSRVRVGQFDELHAPALIESSCQRFLCDALVRVSNGFSNRAWSGANYHSDVKSGERSRMIRKAGLTQSVNLAADSPLVRVWLQDWYQMDVMGLGEVELSRDGVGVIDSERGCMVSNHLLLTYTVTDTDPPVIQRVALTVEEVTDAP